LSILETLARFDNCRIPQGTPRYRSILQIAAENGAPCPYVFNLAVQLFLPNNAVGHEAIAVVLSIGGCFTAHCYSPGQDLDMCAEGSDVVNINFRLQQDLSAIGRVLAAYREERDANNSDGQVQNRTEPLNSFRRKRFGARISLWGSWETA